MRDNRRTSSRRAIATLIAISASVAALSLVVQARDEGTAVPTNVVVTHPSYAYDYSDERILVGAAEFVFLGEVVEQVGDKGVPTSAPDIEIPQTQFLVKVITEIKGKLPPEVVVSQSSGVDKGTGDLILMDGDPLLKPGETVLFAVNSEPAFDWYTIVAGPFGATRAKDALDAEVLVTRFTLAERDQFVPVPDPDFVPPTDENGGERRTE